MSNKVSDNRWISGQKFDAGKPRMDLLPYSSLATVAQVLEFGARKYDAHNWRNGIATSRLAAASLRHVGQWVDGEDNDPESGLSHLAHAACCLLFALWMVEQHPELDDRWKPASSNQENNQDVRNNPEQS